MPYKINEEVLRGDESSFESRLASAHKQKIRPLCLCKPVGLEVYIAHVGTHYIVKRLPGSGSEHGSDCTHYEAPLSISGEGLVMGDAIQEQEEGIVKLKLDFALTKIAGRAPPTPSDKPPETAKADSSRLTMRGLLDYLWKEAGLSKWQPASAGKRSYGVFAKYTLIAANNKFTRSQALADALVIPPPSTGDQDQRSAAQHRIALQISKACTEPSGGRRLGLILGEVYEIEKVSSVSWQLKLLCMLEKPLRVSEELHRRMQKAFDGQIASWNRADNRLIMLATFYQDVSGVPTLQEVTLKTVTKDEWIPFESANERELIAELVRQQRSFQKSLKFNLPKKSVIASCVLTDSTKTTALFIDEPGGDALALEDCIKSAQADGLDVWIWRPGQEVLPPFPAKKGSVITVP